MPFKSLAKRLIGRSRPIDFYEKLTEYSIVEQEYEETLAKAERVGVAKSWDDVLQGRTALWKKALGGLGSILLLEFGVWKGDSIRLATSLNASPKSRFYGFDSFEGLPEEWRGMSTDYFDVGGAIPDIEDRRVQFVKGWFRDTLPGRLDELATAAKGRKVVVHVDADLYSSTLYLLFMLSTRFQSYRVIFDEFSGHESRALYNFSQATGAVFTADYRLDWMDSPQIVSGSLELP